MIQELVSRVFAIRDAAHLAHWQTESGYHHGVLGEFYEDVIGKVDAFAEGHQGAFGRIGKVKLAVRAGEVTKLMQEDVEWIDAHRKELCKRMGALENLLDDLVDLYLSTLFKLENFK